jgi:2-iminobutanoate/2-iminopropanoate deaminase
MGAYSPAVRAGNLLFISGQIPLNPATGELVTGGIQAEAEQVMRNLSALLKAAGLGFEHVVRTTVFLADMNDFAGMNEVYSGYLVDPPPARATVQVAALPRGVRIEIDAIAVIP